MPARDETKKDITRVVTKTPITGKELYEKLAVKYPSKYGGSDARSIGRALGAAVQDGLVIKSGVKSKPKYAKA